MSRFHDLGKRLAACDPAEDPEDEIESPENPTKSKQKDDIDMSDENQAAVDAAKKEGHDAGYKAANDRMNAVFASEHYAGREAMAAKLLGKPSMSAEDIVDVLADTPKAEKSALSEDEARKAAEEAGRKEMKDALSDTTNSGIDADAGKGGAPKAANHGWDEIHAEIRANRAQ